MPTKKTLDKLQLELRDTLEATKYLEVTAVSSRKGDVRAMFRVKSGMDGWWLRMLEQFLVEAPEAWYAFVGQKYLIVNRELRFGWVIIIDGDDVGEVITGVRKLIMSIYSAQTGGTLAVDGEDPEPEIVEVPLPHAQVYQKKSQRRVRRSTGRQVR